MKITQEGNYVRFELYEKESNTDSGWKRQFSFKTHKSNYKELKQHMINALEVFKLK